MGCIYFVFIFINPAGPFSSFIECIFHNLLFKYDNLFHQWKGLESVGAVYIYIVPAYFMENSFILCANWKLKFTLNFLYSFHILFFPITLCTQMAELQSGIQDAHVPIGDGKAHTSSNTPKHSSPTRVRRQLGLFLLLAIILTAVAVGIGVPLMGRAYNINLLLMSPGSETSGMFTLPSQIVGVYLQIYLGTLGLMLFGNFIPSLILLNFSQHIFFSIIVTLLVGFLLAMALIMYYFIEPQKTFTTYPNVSANDPNRSGSGAFFFVGFSFLVGLCLGILQFHTSLKQNRGSSRMGPNKGPDCAHGSIIQMPNDEEYHNGLHSLTFTSRWGMMERLSVQLRNLCCRGRRRALGFIALCVFLAFVFLTRSWLELWQGHFLIEKICLDNVLCVCDAL